MFCRLINERELQLFDGTRLLSTERFESVKEETGLTDQQLAEKYAIVYLCTLDFLGGSGGGWGEVGGGGGSGSWSVLKICKMFCIVPLKAFFF